MKEEVVRVLRRFVDEVESGKIVVEECSFNRPARPIYDEKNVVVRFEPSAITTLRVAYKTNSEAPISRHETPEDT